jgi:hypothetical protein
VDGVIFWCGYVGAWLLVAGPIYQAALELQEQDVERERIQQVTAQVAAPAPVSAWWWLLPPVRYLLAQRRSRRWRQDMIAALSREDLETLVEFIDKARGWSDRRRAQHDRPPAHVAALFQEVRSGQGWECGAWGASGADAGVWRCAHGRGHGRVDRGDRGGRADRGQDRGLPGLAGGGDRRLRADLP